MAESDAVGVLLKQKRAARKTLRAARERATTGRERKRLDEWIAKGDREIASLKSVKRIIRGLGALQRAAREHL